MSSARAETRRAVDCAAGWDPERWVRILDRIQQSLQFGRCLCGLGDSAGWVIMSTMQHFRNEYEEHALRNECSAERIAVHA